MDLEARIRELATLNALADILNRENDFGKALHLSLKRLIDLVDLTTAWVFLSNIEQGDSHQGSFKLVSFTGLPPALAHNDQELLCHGNCECLGMFSRGELDHGVNMVTCSRLTWAKGNKGGLAVHASIPLLGPGGPVGIINLGAPGNTHFDQKTLDFLTTVGRQLGTAFERSRLQEERTQEARYLATLEERHRLASEMHDSVAQLLFAAELSISIAQESQDENQRQRAIAQTSTLIKESLSDLRALVEVMRSPDLSLGLKPALSRLAKRTTGHIQIHLEVDDVKLNPDDADTLYRIAQEAFHNTLRHAKANNIWLGFKQTPEHLMLQIRDDGQGFDVTKIIPGLGLDNMRERVKILAGSIDIQSQPGKGCQIEVMLPWSNS